MEVMESNNINKRRNCQANGIPNKLNLYLKRDKKLKKSISEEDHLLKNIVQKQNFKSLSSILRMVSD